MAKKRRGFTLIELMVVIAIIGLLLVVPISSLQIAKQHATTTICLSNLNGLSRGWSLYAGDNGGNICGANTSSADAPYYDWVEVPQDQAGNSKQSGSTVAEEIIGINRGALYSYIGDPRFYHCPDDRRSVKAPVGGLGGGGYGGYRSYSMPGGMRGVGQPWKPDDPGGWQIIALTNVNDLKSPEEKYVFVEEADGRGYNWGSWVLKPKDPGGWVDPLTIRHNEAGTLAFADGHAEKHTWRDQSTKDMSANQSFYQPVYPTDSGDDLRYMIRGYAYKRLQ